LDLAARIDGLLEDEPDGPAVQYEGEWWDWSHVRQVRDGIEDILATAGLGPHEAVGLVLLERPSAHGALVSLLSRWRCAVLVSPLLPDAALCDDVAGLRLRALVADADDWRPGLVAAAAATGTVGIRLTNDRTAPVEPVEGAGLARALAGATGAQLDEVAVTILTSGTTGPPRRVPLAYESMQGASPTKSEPIGERGVAINALPLVSIGGILGVIDALWRGRPLALMERFDVMQWAELVRRHRPRRIGAPPATLRMLLDRKVPKEYLASAKSFTAASAPLDQQTCDEFEATYGMPVLRAYGATEFLGAITAFTEEDHACFAASKRGSVGRALPGVKIRIVDGDSGVELPHGTTGVLEAQAPRRPVGAPEGWLRTTDLASMDNDGFVWIHGRTDDVLIRGGFKVSAAELEDVLRRHPAVADVAAVDLPDTRLHQVPAAAVTLRDGAPPPTGEELRDWVRRHKPPYYVPVKVVVVDDLPRNAMLKVARGKVRELVQAAR